MKLFILLFFMFLGVGFYEISGGDNFDPEKARVAAVEMRTERNAARAALSGFVSGTIHTRAATDTAPAVDAAVTRQELNLVSFEAVSSPPVESAPVPMLAPTPSVGLDEPTAVALTELSGAVANSPEQINLAALDQVSAAPAPGATADTGTRFTGRSSVASSLPETLAPDIRSVSGTLVNMRSGPSTDFEVIDQLSQGTQVEVLSDTGDGWVELRPVSGGITGWIAEFLLTGS